MTTANIIEIDFVIICVHLHAFRIRQLYPSLPLHSIRLRPTPAYFNKFAPEMSNFLWNTDSIKTQYWATHIASYFGFSFSKRQSFWNGGIAWNELMQSHSRAPNTLCAGAEIWPESYRWTSMRICCGLDVKYSFPHHHPLKLLNSMLCTRQSLCVHQGSG